MNVDLKLVNSIVIEEKNKIIKYTQSVGNMLPKTVFKRPDLIRNFIQTSYSHIQSPGMERPSVHKTGKYNHFSFIHKSRTYDEQTQGIVVNLSLIAYLLKIYC